MTIEFNIKNDQSVILSLDNRNQENNTLFFDLIDADQKVWGRLEVKNNIINLVNKSSRIVDDDGLIESKLDDLLLKIIESENSGTDNYGDDEPMELNPYNPDDIKVRSDKIPITLIAQMIKDNDIDLNPDFQRNLVWDSKQKSRLIESILLRIPLPMFYFSEDKDGKLSVVDGLQRITTIYDFMENKFPLKNLQYLEDSCGGKYYETKGKKEGIDSKYYRWFNLTNISANIIDPASPSKVKYDIFRRINTGGRSLNNQEIRNCLTGQSLREVLKEMTLSEYFKSATDRSIKNKRMDDEEIALRFMMFYEMYERDGNIESYSGYMDNSLDEFTERYSNTSKDKLRKYVLKFFNAMQNAEYLIGRRYAFRKIKQEDIKPMAYKQLINKALFVCTSILLADYEPERVKLGNKEQSLLNPIAYEIENNMELLYYLSYGTNGWKNLTYTFDKLENLFKKTINYESD